MRHLSVYIMLIALMSSATARDSEKLGMADPQSAANKIAEFLQPVLEQEGFARNGLRWYRYENESTLVVDVQPARVLPGPYINLGVYYYKYGSVQYPEIVDCHVDTRLGSLILNPLRGNAILDPYNDIPDDVRRQELNELIHKNAIPWLESLSRFDVAKRVIRENPFAVHVSPIARAELTAPGPD